MKLKDKRFNSHHAINLLKKFRHVPVTRIVVKNFYSDTRMYGKVLGQYKLFFILFDNDNVLSLRFYHNDIQREYTGIAISKKEVEIIKRVFELVEHEK